MSAFYIYFNREQRKIIGFRRIHISDSVNGERILHIDYKDGREENITLTNYDYCSIWDD